MSVHNVVLNQAIRTPLNGSYRYGTPFFNGRRLRLVTPDACASGEAGTSQHGAVANPMTDHPAATLPSTAPAPTGDSASPEFASLDPTIPE
jgi:hypothetical protein